MRTPRPTTQCNTLT